MSVLDPLSPDQRAVVQLILQQGRSYDELAELLRIPAEKVADRARDGLDRLGPLLDDLDPDDQDELSDFILGQQTVSEREATRRFLAASRPGREWATAVTGALREVARDELPEIPGAEPRPEAPLAPAPDAGAVTGATGLGATAGATVPEIPSPYAPPPGTTAVRDHAGAVETLPEEPPTSKLGGAVLVGCIVLILAAVVVLVLNRDDDPATPPTPTVATTQAAPPPQQVGQVVLEGRGRARDARGLAQVLAQGEQLAFALVAENLPTTGENAAYAVWVVSAGGGRAQRLGYAPAVQEDGLMQTSGELPQDIGRYRDLVVSRETAETERPTRVVLRGRLPAEVREAAGG